MNKITRLGLKNLIAQNNARKAIEDLFSLFLVYMEKNGSEDLTTHYDNLILISGKLNGLHQEIDLGVIENNFANLEKNRINHSLLNFINGIPDHIFSLLKTEDIPKKKSSDFKSQVRQEFTENEFEFDIFLSFSSKDREITKKIWEELRDYGLKVFLSDESLKMSVGQSFFERTQEALENSKHFVLVCTPNSMSSE
ncbi:MAG: TIR domain-containing protein [Bacteroidota bacterium]